MQFTALSSLIYLSLSTFALAIPSGTLSSPQCTNKHVCCQATGTINGIPEAVIDSLKLIGYNSADLTGEVGLSCTPFPTSGCVGDEPIELCCERNVLDGVLSDGCTYNIGNSTTSK